MKNLMLMLIVGMFLISFASSQVDVYPDGDMPIEETTITANIVGAEVVQAEYIYTKSQVPIPSFNYMALLMSTDIFNKFTHYAYRLFSNKPVLDNEYRGVVLEGAFQQMGKEMCAKDKNKWSWC
jgi:hypothetical protein